VAEAVAKLVAGGMLVGIGTGTTISQLLPLLPGRDVVYIATSPITEMAALKLGLSVQPQQRSSRSRLPCAAAAAPETLGHRGWLRVTTVMSR
jgi:ribose 5-phosphate isomerase